MSVLLMRLDYIRMMVAQCTLKNAICFIQFKIDDRMQLFPFTYNTREELL